MAKFFGKVGFSVTKETSPGVWSEEVEEFDYYGDVTRNSRRWENSETLNDNLTFNNTVSIVADEYAYRNFSAIRYIKWMGASWKVTTVEVARPRLILTFGGVYNGPETGTPDDFGEDDSWC